MYRIIGGDQREYGPVSAEDVRRWIAEGRLNQYSQAKGSSEVEWKPLGQFPEFRDAFAIDEPPPSPGSPPPPIDPAIWVEEMLAREPFVPVGLCLARAWELTWANFNLLFKSCLLIWLVGLAQFLPLVGLAYNVFIGVFYGGLCLVFLKRIRSEPAKPSEVFDGFNIAFPQLLLVGVIVWLLTQVGLCLCIVPGVFLFVCWIFAVPLVADKRLEFWSAMELSRKVVVRVWFPVFLVLLLSLLPVVLLSATTFVKGSSTAFNMILESVRMPSPPDIARTLERAWRVNAETFGLKFFTRVVFLFNLPFAVAAMMYAYESLFGPRNSSAA